MKKRTPKCLERLPGKPHLICYKPANHTGEHLATRAAKRYYWGRPGGYGPAFPSEAGVKS